MIGKVICAVASLLFSSVAASGQGGAALDIRYAASMQFSDKVLNAIEDVATRQAMIDHARSFNKTFSLYFDGRIALFSEAEVTDTSGVDFAKVGKLYTDLATRKTVKSEDLLGKQFFVDDTARAFDWDIDMETAATVLGKTCYKATTGQGESKVVAWFCPEVPAPVGPSGYGGLPGLILRVVSGSFTYEATQVAATKSGVAVTLPRAKDMTPREEYDKIRNDKFKALGVDLEAANGSSGVIVLD